MISRRRLLLVLAPAAILVSCTKEARCAHCGMKLDPKSTWNAELAGGAGGTDRFDTPRCALTTLRTSGRAAAHVRVLEYYERVSRDGAELRFVAGSDVLGPMGPDMIPVAPERADKFVKDHGGRALALPEITAQMLEDLK